MKFFENHFETLGILNFYPRQTYILKTFRSCKTNLGDNSILKGTLSQTFNMLEKGFFSEIAIPNLEVQQFEEKISDIKVGFLNIANPLLKMTKFKTEYKLC